MFPSTSVAVSKRFLYDALLLTLTFGPIVVRCCASDCNDVASAAVCSGNGVYADNSTACLCNEGWQGPECQYCGGKVKLNSTTGYISDGIGNYPLDVKCTWLIEAGNSTNSTIRFHFEEFSTECGWDKLYINDGDNVNSPLLGVYSGFMSSKDYSLQNVPGVVACSGYALLHFYSDLVSNFSGFKIAYSVNSCPSMTSFKECSGNGICINSLCNCDTAFTGEACHVPICPNKCSADNGVCDQKQHHCICNPKYKGDDCSQVAEHGYWEVLKTPRNTSVPQGSASHTAIVWQNLMYVVGGESFKKKKNILYVYDFDDHEWKIPLVITKTIPTIQNGHSSVMFNDKIYVYGGVKENSIACNEFWIYDISVKSWENVTVNTRVCEQNIMNISSIYQTLCGPLASTGHTATLVPPDQSISSSANNKHVTERMIVIFGHSPTYGFMNFVQEYYFNTNEWGIVKTKGYPVKGGYYHSATWDPVTKRILVYGGYVSTSLQESSLSSKMYAYDPYTYTWYLMSSGPNGRYLHSGSILNPSGGLILMYGGNVHDNIDANSMLSSVQCFTEHPYLYDTYCDSWTQMSLPSDFSNSVKRFGHSAVIFKNSTYIYGGFNGQMFNDILKFTPGNCSTINMTTDCLNSHHYGTKCVWNNMKSICLPISEIPDSVDLEPTSYSRCQENNMVQIDRISLQCNQQITCEKCVHTNNCGWCSLSNSCVHDLEKCSPVNGNHSDERPTKSDCTGDNSDYIRCDQLHSCRSCVTRTGCHWDSKLELESCVPITNVTLSSFDTSESVCNPTCDQFKDCESCPKYECIWCQNNDLCVDRNLLSSAFPYGQCREIIPQTCRGLQLDKSRCDFYQTCKDCRYDPECGWCDDGSGTGRGSCMAGGGNSPPNSCSKNKWFFTHCPFCQCNGHSTCTNNTLSGVCTQPCSDNTDGPDCGTCAKRFFGNPINGGECKECRCDKRAADNYCDKSTGKCKCAIKGFIGDNCEECDTRNNYIRDPFNVNGSCFYNMTTDYQYTFNLSSKQQLGYSQINFQDSPQKSSLDVQFNISCSDAAKFNVTFITGIAHHGPEETLYSSQNCSSIGDVIKFSKTDFVFGVEGHVPQTTFHVYVYDFKPPLSIRTSFAQYNPVLDVPQLQVTLGTLKLIKVFGDIGLLT